MAYVFNGAGAETFATLQDQVLGNSFSVTRMQGHARLALNDGVEQVIRRLGVGRGGAVCDYADNGFVIQPAAPEGTFFRVEGVWLAPPEASGSTYTQAARWARTELEPVPWDNPAGITGDTPTFYTARRQAAWGVFDRKHSMLIHVLPCTRAGKVAIVGLQRPPIMVNPGDVTCLDSDLNRAVVAYAKARLFEQEDDFQMSQQWDARFNTILAEGAYDAVSDGPRQTSGSEDFFSSDRGR